MKLKNLLPIREAKEEMSPELMALPFFREFQTSHGYKPLFRFIGTKADQHIFTAVLSNVGQLDLIIKEAVIMAKIEEKEAVFGKLSANGEPAPYCTQQHLQEHEGRA
jgi:hypothetical protein